MKVTIFSLPGMHGEFLKTRAQRAMSQAGVCGKVEVRTGEFDFAQAGVLFTPAISVNGRLVTNGWVPEEGEFEKILRSYMA